jgi:hypothetical protein
VGVFTAPGLPLAHVQLRNPGLNKYKNVAIWCARFGVNFATAPLASAKSYIMKDKKKHEDG